MQHKTKKIWLIALLSLLIAALFAASFTYARYYKETGVTGGKYDDTIEFVGANKYIVYTPEELVAAIENGYSYIEIADGAEEPFVITDGVTDVTANLVLDINGHSLVRNSRNPLIDVQENVSVVIVYDSKASGSFYNPVGSLLQASGGTLTIATGNFTSGPKAEDYVTDVGTTGEGVSYSLENYTVYYRDGYTPGATSPNRSAEYIDTGVEAYLPKIVPVVIDPEAEDRYGNIYFENGIGDNDYIKDDTFLIYTEETVETPEDATVNVDFSPLCDVASCDFYYYYEKSTEGSGEDKTTTYAVIYGYHDVMAGAKKQITKTGFNTSGSINNNSAEAVIWPYAAVRMTEGEAFIRGGTYTNQFGKAQSYGIYARGGSLSVQGENTSFTSVADGVCIRCTTEGGSAPALHIENGSFTSYNGDTVQVNGGTMTVESGTFTKDATAALSDSTNNGSAISISGGKLSINGSGAENGKSVSFNINGSHVNGVKMEKTENDQTDIIKNAAFSFNHGHGGNSVAAIQVIGGKLEVSSSTFNFNQDHSGQSSANNGIYVQGGSVTATGCTFSLNPNGSVTRSAAIASVGGSVTATGSEFSVKGNSNYGVYSSGGTITATDCDITMTGTGSGRNDNFGIYSTLQEGSTGGTATANGCTIIINGTYSAGVLAVTDGQAMSADEYAVTVADSAIVVNFYENTLSSSGISTEGGNIQLNGGVSVNSQGLGITARTGSINIASGTASVTTLRGTGVYVNNGTLTVNEVATLSVQSTMTENSWVNPPGVSGNVVTHYDGIVVEGGSLVSNGTLNVEFTGVANTTTDYDYTNFETRSYAVRVEGGKGTSVLINKGTITNDKGGGLYVNSSDSWSIGEQNIKDLTFEGISAQDATKVELKAVDISTTGTGTVSTKNIQSNWNYNLYTEGGPAVKVNQGVLRIAGGTYTAKSGDGIRVQGGVAFVEGGYFVGRDYTGNSDAYLPGAGASYAFKVFGGHAKVTGGVFGRISENETTGQGNGAFVMGGTAYITKADIQAGGTTAFSVWTNANVTFNGTNEDIQVIGDSTGLAIETGGTNPALSVTINGGTFKGTDKSNTNTNGIWYGNSNAQLTITNGYFEGARRSGLRMDVEPSWDWDNVQLSGGTFLTTQGSGYNAISADRDFGYSRILETGARAYSGGNDLSNRNVNDGNGRYTNITIG